MCNSEADMDEKKIRELAGMVYRRKRAVVPDVESELKNLLDEDSSAEDTSARHREHGRSSWRLVAAAMLGAAAMFVGFMFYLKISEKEVNVLAMKYDDTPQRVLLDAGGMAFDVSEMDSIDLCDAAVASRLKTSVRTVSAQETTLHTLSTPRGMDFKVTFQDGTEVWLDAESNIEFPSAFTSDERRVSVSGEAYFRVAHDEDKPFIVNVAGKDIRVLGTEFNVRSYGMEDTQVALVSGRVELCDSGRTERCVVLKPGQGATWGDGTDISVGEVDTYLVTQWTEGLFYFDEQPLSFILRELGRWYNMGVLFRNNKHLDYKIHFSALRSDDLQAVLNDLGALCPFKIVIEGNNVVVY